jgi:hypothetical protein
MSETEWNSTTLPRDGELVRVLAHDVRGHYVIPFPVVFRNDTWWNAGSGALLDAQIIGWRPQNVAPALPQSFPQPNFDPRHSRR